MKTQNHSEVAAKMDKQALRVYGGLSLVVYAIALAYCYFTERLFEVGIMGTVMLFLGILIAYMYQSIGKETKSHEIQHPLKNAA